MPQQPKECEVNCCPEGARLWVTLGLLGRLICSAPGRAGAGPGGLLPWTNLLQLPPSPGTATALALSLVCAVFPVSGSAIITH